MQWPPLQTQWHEIFLQVQEAPGDHGDGACSFSPKTNQGGAP